MVVRQSLIKSSEGSEWINKRRCIIRLTRRSTVLI